MCVGMSRMAVTDFIKLAFSAGLTVVCFLFLMVISTAGIDGKQT